jgi:ribosome biogenesis GTPase / thiamine phosphate phosphatase
VESKDYYVLSEDLDGSIRCSLKGKIKDDFNLKKDKLYKVNLIVVGDEVEFDLNKDGSGVINKIYERRNYLSRKAPRLKGAGYRGERLEQVIAANIDNLFIVTSISHPAFNNKSLDRIIVTGESSHLNIFVLMNKCDLDHDNEIENWVELYRNIGYKVVKCSVKTSIGLDKIKSVLRDSKNLFWGSSGVGKSSILNALYPKLEFKTQSISAATLKGKHTTVTSILKEVEKDTFIIDTPGIREIDPYGIKKENLGHYFNDFLPYLGNCRFNTCTHFHEPGCGVIEAVNSKNIFPQRYESYLNLLNTIEDDMVF